MVIPPAPAASGPRRTAGRTALAAGLTGVLGLGLLLSGCALKRDLDVTIDEVVALKRKQADDYREVKAELDRRAGRIEADQTDLTASQTEFQNQAEAIAAQLAQLGSAITTLRDQVDELSHQVKALRNDQVIGLGSLSQRVDESGAQAQGAVADQGEKLDAFATEVSGQVDAQGKQVRTLSKGVADLTARDKQRAKAVDDLSKKLDALGKKLTAEVSAQGQKISQGQGADAGEVAALRKQVSFLGDKLPKEVDAQTKRVASMEKDLRDMAALLADLNTRLKALEGR